MAQNGCLFHFIDNSQFCQCANSHESAHHMTGTALLSGETVYHRSTDINPCARAGRLQILRFVLSVWPEDIYWQINKQS